MKKETQKGGLRFIVAKPKRVNWSLYGIGFWPFKKFSSISKPKTKTSVREELR